MSGRGIGRRLPPLIMGALALALMIAILPSSLHLPVTGPGSQAEVAPVPGQGQNQSNLSQLGLADSGTVGEGGNAAAGDALLALPALPANIVAGLNPRGAAQQHRCFGSPPRQTEDPLSPPCASPFAGDNGGATTHGVTRNVITVVDVDSLHSRAIDYTAPVSSSDTPYIRTIKVLLAYFQARFETYGRKVQVLGYGKANAAPSAADVDQRFNHPFAVIGAAGFTNAGRSYSTRGMEQFFGDMAGVDSAFLPSASSLTQHSPYEWHLEPNADTHISAAAEWFCAAVARRPAAMAGDPTLALRQRRVALGYEGGTTGGLAEHRSQADAFQAAVRQRCDQTFPVVFDITDLGSRQANVAAMLQDGDTTILCFLCTSLFNYDSAFQQANYVPEHLFVEGPVTNQFGRKQLQSEWHNASGITFHWRARPPAQTYWWAAYTEIDRADTPDLNAAYTAYEQYLQLFSAIQLAGPRLTPSQVETGMRTWSRHAADSFSPSATYAPGTYDFVDDFAWMRWDQAGIPPGGSQANGVGTTNPTGCYRMVDDGHRFGTSSEPWPTTDDAAARADWPCTADEDSDANSVNDTSG
ncbi:MAG: hypothetical protein ACYDGR_05070 [Candidatus Dormibacteria bacterium]